MAAPRRDSVQSLERALDLLEALASRPRAGVTELPAPLRPPAEHGPPPARPR